MWALKFLSGPMLGQVVALKSGKNLVGRAEQCEIKISSNGVSKEHAEIQISHDKVILVDLRSSNGTFVNGVKIQNSLLKMGDKLSFFDVIAELVPSVLVNANANANAKRGSLNPTIKNQSMPSQNFNEFNSPLTQSSPPLAESVLPKNSQTSQRRGDNILDEIKIRIAEYFDRVVLPGVYKLAEILEFKIVLLSFVFIYILMVTILSLFPMVQITKESIEKESTRRAQSLAKNLALINQKPLLEGTISALNTYQAEAEEGVVQALIIQQTDGMIVAPATKAGTTPNLAFVHVARREARSQAMVIDSKTIGASYPIGVYNPSTGEPEVKAHAIIIYDISSMAFDTDRVISLFMQTMVVASLIGFGLYFFMIKLIEFPLASLNYQLDIALREKKETLEVSFNYPVLQNLVSNMNSLLTRYLAQANNEASVSPQNINIENQVQSVLTIMGLPAIACSEQSQIIGMNRGFELLTRTVANEMIGRSLQAIPDSSLQANLQGLIELSVQDPMKTHHDRLDISGHACRLSVTMMGVEQEKYYLIAISPAEEAS